MVEQISTKECLFVLVDVNVRTGKRMGGCGDGRVLGAYGRDESHPTVWVVLFGSTVSERLSF